MIVLNVGAYKCGSTWVQNILLEGLPRSDCAELPHVLDSADMPPEIGAMHGARESKLKLYNCLRLPPQNGVFLFKLHIWSELDEVLPLLCRASEVRFINITREPKDVIVSRYYHELAAHRFSGTFKRFLRASGREKLRELVGYHAFWRRAKSVMPTRVHFLDYADLHANYGKAVSELFLFLGIADVNMANLAPIANLDTNRERFTREWMRPFRDFGMSFYRKGVVGDWKNHFDSQDLLMFNQWMDELTLEIGT